MSAKQETPSNAGSNADLSESALPYTTKEIEVEEVDFCVEINGLVNGGDGSAKGVLGWPCSAIEIVMYLLSAAYSTHWDGDGRKGEGGGAGRMKGG